MGSIEDIDFQKLLLTIKQAAYDSWGGKTGEERALSVEKVIINRSQEYAQQFDLTPFQVLSYWEANRRVNVVNHYQESHIPPLAGVHVFATRDALRESNPSGEFICPACGERQKGASECMSETVRGGSRCGWKSYGFLGTLGKGVKVLVADMLAQYPTPIEIFYPADWEPKP